ncbi:endonuclease/exonuclease/phosphatase family protein [Flavimaricola marinus]|uniref:Endonuclease/Exonuclease/phosphatase family protein n=1 Tax=Flavimaricola marinus TaxID=1819565 RepID=A0A238LG17_9RHOB|nr:endonuclease/exonuclease/phosphatase family protein [Flavimaricola marinus]SMY08522.1 Endonuclease/Exonuclease/phosphatase family protein [Flavimaricola marinus]
MRLATYNVEWFDHLFDDHGRLRDDGGWSGRYDVTRREQTAALGHVFAALDADAVMIIEAPDSSRRRDGAVALESFARHFGLRTNKALIGYVNDTQQEIALLYDPDTVTAEHDPQEDATAPRFDQAFHFDLDTDATPETIRWSKPPLEVALQTGGASLRLIGVHAKSKAPHGARNNAHAIRLSIENRRKQLAQCIWLRRRVQAHLEAGDPLIVLGDFNDGPGLDEYEKLFGRSGVEVVLGEGDGIQLFDPHARIALSSRIGVQPATARFKKPDGPYLSALLDYIMVSPDLRQPDSAWRIWHPFDDPQCFSDLDLREALLTASDHFPVTLDLAL